MQTGIASHEYVLKHFVFNEPIIESSLNPGLHSKSTYDTSDRQRPGIGAGTQLLRKNIKLN